jgi:hypothetical protein
LPRLRFTRDQRGYENTFLVHTSRRRGKERTRILYWFRSPPHVKVGRAAFDEEAIRAIEAANPDIAFDWSKILEARPPESEMETRRQRRGRGDRDRERLETIPRSTPPVRAPVTDAPEASQAREPIVPAESVPGRAPGPEDNEEDAEGRPASASQPSAAERALGTEGLSRVRARYAEVLARISAQITDDAVADELRGLAERLNPDAWVTADEVRLGLEDFERVLEQLRQRLGPPGRPRRDRRAGDAATSSEPAVTCDAAPPAGRGTPVNPARD